MNYTPEHLFQRGFNDADNGQPSRLPDNPDYAQGYQAGLESQEYMQSDSDPESFAQATTEHNGFRATYRRGSSL